jgi:hypothetical protein
LLTKRRSEVSDKEKPEYPPEWDNIPDREPLPPPGRGPGIDYDGDLTKIKGADLIGRKFGVLGFNILPSGYSDDDDEDAGQGKGEYAVVHIILENGKEYRWNTSAKAVLRVLTERWERNELPFRTALEEVKSGRSRYSYYRLAD